MQIRIKPTKFNTDPKHCIKLKWQIYPSYLDRGEVALPTDSHVLVRSTNHLEDKKTIKETVPQGKWIDQGLQ
jgi:hypothetical protein